MSIMGQFDAFFLRNKSVSNRSLSLFLGSIFLICLSQIAYGELSNQLIIKFKDPQTSNVLRANALFSRFKPSSVASLRVLRAQSGGGQVLKLGGQFSQAELIALVTELASDPSVEYVERDLVMRASYVPNDPLYADQWHYYEPLGGINLPVAWDTSLGDDDVVVAVLDTGYRPHTDLVSNLLPGYDFISDTFIANDGDGRDSDSSDPGDSMVAKECGDGFPSEDEPSSWHGTHVAGIIAAVTDNGIGVAGIAPNAKILPVRVLGKCGGYVSDVSDAIRWSAGLSVAGVPDNANPAKIINLSLSAAVPEKCPTSYANAIADARAAGAIVMVAAGNFAANADEYSPGNCANVLTVSATDRDGGRASYSNYGETVDISAPGGELSTHENGILSVSNEGTHAPATDGYFHYEGTSMAVPHVAGISALLLSVRSDLSPDELKTALRKTARSFPESCTGCGVGIVNAAQAIAWVGRGVLPVDKANLSAVLKGQNGKFKKDVDSTGAGRIRYQAIVTNHGPDVASNTLVMHTFPTEIIAIDVQAQQGVCYSESAICHLGDIVNGASVEMTIEVLTANDQKMDFEVVVASDSTDYDVSDNSAVKKFGGALSWLLVILIVGGIRQQGRLND
jgi:serine protease